MQFTNPDMNPATNPGVLDTATWDRSSGWQAVARMGEQWLQVQRAATEGRALPPCEGVRPFTGSCKTRGATVFCLTALPDAQQVFVEIGTGGGPEALGEPMGTARLSSGIRVAAYPADAALVFHHYSFAFVGRRDASGRFLQREEFYGLLPDFYRAYRTRIADYLAGLVNELF